MEEPKKRGRKKKSEQIQEPITEMKKTNKRGRKAKVIEFKKNVKLTEFNLEEPCILSLPVNLNKLIKEIPCRLGIESILFKPINGDFNGSGSGSGKENGDGKGSGKENGNGNGNGSVPDIYNSIDKHGNPDKITVYNNTPLPVNLDHNNVRKIEACKTDVACWWCCHTFDTYPICCPLKYDSVKDIFNVVGVFCSFNCSKAYSAKEKGNYSSYNSFLYNKIKSQLNNIKQAPDKIVLKMFGGPLTIEEYRSTFSTLSNIKINKYPMVFIPLQIEYHKVNDMVKNSMNKINTAKSRTSELTKNTIVKATQRISLSKKQQNINDNTLLDIMGIKIKN